MTFNLASASCSKSEIVSAIGQNPTYPFMTGTKLSCVGTIPVGRKTYLVVYYDWNESNKEAEARGGNPHAKHRILIFETLSRKLRYIGSYGVTDAPLGISGRKIRFAHQWEGGEITFGNEGPPAHVLIDGDFLSLDR